MIGRVIAQRYQIVDMVGKGGMAIVYRAIDLRTGHSVAIKVLRSEFNQDEEFLNRFQREAEAASKVSHHNIVNLLDVGMDENMRYLVMEYVQGKTLKAVIKEKGKLAPATAVQIAIRILSALQHTHRNGIIHRDIKPQNILVQSEGHIKVSDFGIARMANSSTLTKGDSVMGSVHYFSPEQAAGEDVFETGDIYSVGVVLYEMLTGQVPFDGDSPVAVAMQHIHNKPRPIHELAPEVPPAIEKVVMTAMEKDPKYRYQNALDMAADLKKALESKDDLAQTKVDSQTIPALKEQGTGDLPKIHTDRLKARRKHTKPTKVQIQKRLKSILRIAITVATAMLIFFGLYLGGTAIYKQIVNTTKAPDLISLDEASAQQKVDRAGLIPEVYYVDVGGTPGNVVDQAPAFEEQMQKGEVIVIYVQRAQEHIPALINYYRSEAASLIKNLDMTLEIQRVLSERPYDLILDQSPPEGNPAEPGGTIIVTVSGGSVTVPNVMGRLLSQARSLLSQDNLLIGRLIGVPVGEGQEDGTIIAQDPAPNADPVMQNTSVQLYLTDARWQAYQRMITITVPESETNTSVRVALVEQDGSETTQYDGILRSDDNRSIKIILYHSEEGSHTYRVYYNQELAIEEEALLVQEQGMPGV